jgi:thymidylate synthase (FAD)
MKIELINYSENAEKKIALAAKLCYASDAERIYDDENVNEFVNKLKKMGHMSPFEHASYSFLIEGISRVTSHQLVRHRLASYSQRSQRYVSHDNFEYITPPSLENKTIIFDDRSEQNAKYYYRECMEKIADMYKLLSEAVDDEDARYILPNACETKIVATMNTRELIHFFNERLCQRAQWEIRNMAAEMLKSVKEVSPIIFKNVGPKCVELEKCPEGKMSCGKLNKMLQKYKEDECV